MAKLITFCVISICLQLINGSTLLLTNTVQYSGQIYHDDTFKFSYNFYLQAINDSLTDPIFSNKIQIFNFSIISVPADYFHAEFPFFLYFYRSSENHVDCVSLDQKNTSCVSRFPNGRLTWFFYLSAGDRATAAPASDSIGLFVNDGKLFNLKDGSFFTEDDNCTSYEYNDENNYQYVCSSSDFDPVEISNFQNAQCNTFQTNATIIDEEKNFTIKFVVNYLKVNEDLNINIEILEAPEMEYTFHFGPNEVTDVCVGNNTVKNATCILKDAFGKSNMDFEMVFVFIDIGNAKILYNGIIGGEIIYAFEKFYKDFNVQYTANDPCWIKTNSSVVFTNAIYNAQFCCTNFDEDIFTSTTVSDLISTTSNSLKQTTSVNMESFSTTTSIKNASLRNLNFLQVFWTWLFVIRFFMFCL